MIPFGPRPLRVAVAGGDGAIADALSEGDDGDGVEADPVAPSAAADPDAALDGRSVDCVVVDAAGVDDAAGTVETADAPRAPPVVLLAEDATDRTLADALAAGAADALPRSLVRTRPALAVDRLTAAVERERARAAGGGDGPTRLLDAADVAVVVHDPETGEVVDANRRFCETTGSDREDLLGRRVGTLAPDEESDGQVAYEQRLREAVEEAETEDGGAMANRRSFEWVTEDVAGDTRRVEVSPRTATVAGREVVVSTLREVADADRGRPEHEYERLFDTINDVVAVRDPETGEIVDANRPYADLLGYDREEMRGMSVADVGVPEEGYDDERGMETLREVMESDDPVEFEWKVTDADGETHLMDVRGTSAVVGGEERYIAIARDITDRRRRQRELEEEREKYSTLVEQSSDAIVVVQDGEYAFVNRRFAEITGVDREDLLGRPFDEVFTPESRELVRERYRRRIEGESPPDRYDVEVETADGEVCTLDLAVSRITHEGAPATLANLRDVTRRKRRERAIGGLQGATERMQNAETATEVAEAAVEAARDALDLPVAACWFRDADADRLDPVAATDPVHDRGLVSPLGADRYEYAAFREGEVATYTPNEENPDNPLETAVLLPLGEHGLLAAGRADEVAYDAVTLDVARTLAEHTTTALDRVERAREVRESERRFRLIAERIEQVIYLTTGDFSEALYVNSAYEEIWGRSADELDDDPEAFVESVHPDDRAAFEAEWEAMVDDIRRGDAADRYEFDYRIRRPDGEVRWMRGIGYPVELPTGERRFVGFTEDVTDRRELERTYRSVFENVSDGLVVHDPETGEVVDVNRRFCEMNGYDPEELVGSTVDVVTGEGYEYEAAEEYIARAREGDRQLFEWRNRRKDGETFPTEVHLGVVDVRGEERVLASVRDVTERKRRERVVRRLHRATERIQDAETATEVAEAAVEAASDILDLPMTACWLRTCGDGDDADSLRVDGDGDGPTLDPVAATDPVREYGPASFGPGDPEYEAVADGETLRYDPSQRFPDNPLDAALMVPVGDRGLLGAGRPGADDYPDFVADAAQTLAAHVRTALDRVDRARELRESERRFRTIAERVNELIYLANADMTEVLYVNPAYEEVFGRPVDELHDDARAFFDAVHPDDREAYVADAEAMLADIDAGDPDDRYEFSFRVERPDGEVRWVESTGYPVVGDDGEPDRLVGVSEDVTRRKRRERTLETFQEATRELTAASSREAACRQAVRAADEVLGFPLVSVHLYDEESGRLEPTAVTDRLAGLDAEPPAFGPGESLPWRVYVEGESTTSSAPTTGVYGPGVSDPDVVVPLGSHGVMLVGAPTDSFDAPDVELAQILAATLEAALNHVAGERALEERERELRRQQERAERLERLNAIVTDIEQVTVERSSRTGIEEAVCERLTDVDGHELVWVAEPAVGSDELVPRTSAGGNDAYVDALTVDLAEGEGTGTGGHPAVAAYRREAVRTVRNVATDVAGGSWRKTALRHGVQSVVAVPIRYENTVHGVLSVASDRPDAFDEATEEALAELGRSIGYAITVTEREQALESEGTTELEFAVGDEGLFMVRGSAAADCRVELERTVRRTGGSFSTFYVVEGADPADLADLANAAPSVETAQVVSAADDDDDEERGLIEVTAPTWFGSAFTTHGAVVREAEADAGEGTLVVECPRGANVRALVEGFEQRYPDAELAAQRQRERSVRSPFELQDVLREGLTDRQWEALETAYSAGYFEWPRETSGEEAAALLGVTQPTFNKHLRIAERTAFRMLLDREYPGSG